MITSFTAYGVAKLSATPLITLARQRGSTATTRAGAYRYLRADIPTPALALLLTAHPRPVMGPGRGRAAALAARYERHGLAACKRFGLERRDQLDLEEIKVELPVKVISAIRKAVQVRYAYPLTVTRSDVAPRLEGSGAYSRWGGKWKSARGSYQASTRVVRVGYEWIMREPELRLMIVAARLRGDGNGKV